ncbi:glycosyltransferase BC10 isoform X1 [Vigna umbellata]|uniref:glycosyltransferase BC10 isoform X1 n=1 Tax=Vigna umbellata TaxID=87088 RepID=UPI001F5ED9DB|nr:glycosyltransferase BC10 isoform X1 [Vigna umbellata]
MGRNQREREEGDKHAGLLKLAQILTYLVVFAGGVVMGLTTSSHIHNTNFISQPYRNPHHPNNYIPISNCSSTAASPPPPPPPPPPSSPPPPPPPLDMGEFLHPPNLTHTLSDDELFWRASLMPKKEGYPFRRIPKVAFMFLTRGPLPMLPLWERFFNGHAPLFSIYVHAPPRFHLNVSESSPFYGRQIPSQDVSWGTVTLADAERRLLANALLDFSNERFVLLSESCIPIYNFPTVYRYLTDSAHSFVESYDDPTRYGCGRYSRSMLPHIQLRHWRKGSQWFELNRLLAVYIISDTQYFSLFRKYCKPACYPDEHYIPTFLNMFHGPLNSNRTITWVDWSMLGPHPASFGRANITADFIQALRNNGSLCRYNSEMTSICYLFARKFDPSALEPLLNLSSQIGCILQIDVVEPSLCYFMLTQIYFENYTDEEIDRCFEEFDEDVHTEFLKFGEIVNFKVLFYCCVCVCV